MTIKIMQSAAPVLGPKPGCPWADTAVLNPAVLRDDKTGEMHMLFRATGPFPEKQDKKNPNAPLPYPIFLGYAVSRDDGKTWDADFSRPALAPAIADTIDGIWIQDHRGKRVINHANGCIEDPRFVELDGDLYVAVACRMFPPGPYWEHDDPMQCAPEWAKKPGHPFGRAGSENLTVSVVFRVFLDELKKKNYEKAFAYAGPITCPEYGDNRDAFLFPEKLKIAGRESVLAVHRPWQSHLYPDAKPGMRASIWFAAADCMEDLGTKKAKHIILAEPMFEWEGDRIGASWPILKLGKNEWLLPYHGKKDPIKGYTQSFMILTRGENGWPAVQHRCSERLMYARHAWELDKSKFKTPCVFTTAGFKYGDTLWMAYGAADIQIGYATVSFKELISHIRTFDANGRQHQGGN